MEPETAPGEPDPLPPAILAWSSGKDAAHALFTVRRSRTVQVVALVTTVVAATGRVATHGVRGELLDRQAESVGLPLVRVPLPASPSNAVYERGMEAAVRPFRDRGVRRVVFGDLFLEDIRAFRERQFSKLGMECLFPLWGKETRGLAEEMIRSGLEARLVAVDPQRVPGSWAGRRFDSAMLEELPPGVDPCGENGEFHTFVTASPVFRYPVPVRVGAVRATERSVGADLIPKSSEHAEGSDPHKG